jgi:hypothetical protein
MFFSSSNPSQKKTQKEVVRKYLDEDGFEGPLFYNHLQQGIEFNIFSLFLVTETHWVTVEEENESKGIQPAPIFTNLPSPKKKAPPPLVLQKEKKKPTTTTTNGNEVDEEGKGKKRGRKKKDEEEKEDMKEKVDKKEPKKKKKVPEKTNPQKNIMSFFSKQ